MEKVKPAAFSVGIMLLVGAALCFYFSLRNLADMRPAKAYEDEGVYTFVPEEVHSVRVENHAVGQAGRDPYKIVYKVYYRAQEDSSYQYKEEFSVEVLAQNVVEEGKAIQRRVLSIPQEGGYITIDANETADTYVSSQKTKYFVIAAVCFAYMAAWGVGAAILAKKRHDADQWA